jgi:toxin-antitoxin system PIN domain toxin
MVLPDVNVLIYAFRREAPRHAEFRRWLDSAISGPAAFGLYDSVLSSFLRIITNPRVFQYATPVAAGLTFVEALRQSPNSVLVSPGPRHWSIFADLCRKAEAKGNLIADAYLAALAIENGCQWITTDRDYARFPGLDWKHPLD